MSVKQVYYLFTINDSTFHVTRPPIIIKINHSARVAIRPALGRTVRFFQCPVQRPVQHQARRVFVLLFETTPPVIGPFAGHRSVVCYDRAPPPRRP